MQLAAIAMKGRGFMLCRQGRGAGGSKVSAALAVCCRCCFLSVASSCCHCCLLGIASLLLLLLVLVWQRVEAQVP